MPLIRCMRPFKSAQGHRLPCNGVVYQFTPNNLGHYVADVREKDVATVLSIGAGYQPYEGDVADIGAPPEGFGEDEAGPELFEEPSTMFLEPTKTEFKAEPTLSPRQLAAQHAREAKAAKAEANKESA